MLATLGKDEPITLLGKKVSKARVSMRRCTKLIIALAVVSCLAWLLWFCCFRTTFRSESTTLSYVTFGPPESILVVVLSQDGTPASGVGVTIENNSGEQGGITDSSGQVIIRPGESEVLRIWIGAEEFRLRHTFLLDDFFAPGCMGDGLTFIALTSKSNPAQQDAP